MNAVEIEEAISLLAEQPFVPAEFPYAFLEAFGNKETTIKRLRTGNNNKSDIEGGVLQQNNIHIAVCEAGKVGETLTKLKLSPATTKAKAKFILATDGREFQAEDMNSGETVACDYPAFHNHFGFFLLLAGISTVKQIRDDAFDIKATGRLNKLYIELLHHNPEWATAERRHDMNHFLARLIFCFFAEDTGIFSKDGLFTETVRRMSANDASITHEVISEIFRTMDTKRDQRSAKKTKNWTSEFPYVNGELFSGSTDTPKFTKIARSYLLHVGSLDWKKINPDIFGSMIQAVADEDERGALGMHYTSVPNILKVLNPLFLDDLRIQLEESGENARKLLNLRKRISRIRVFDPACGSGNFLVIAYKQMREIEYEINKRRGELNLPSEIPLTNFRGIELRDFSAEIARLALIIAEYQCDVLYRGQKLALADFLPLDAENWITSGNALRINWFSICPPTGINVNLRVDDLFSASTGQSEINFENEGGETYICGNPPYKGSKWQSLNQKSDLKTAWFKYPKLAKTTDYVTGWIAKANEYLNKEEKCIAAFVMTNSVVQGQQAGDLWEPLFKNNIGIKFAHQSFKWHNLASNNAGVTVVIVGISKTPIVNCQLFDEHSVRTVNSIGCFLVPNQTTNIIARKKPLSDLPEMLFGNMPRDGGHLILNKEEADILKMDLGKIDVVKKYIGSKELISGIQRFCLWIEDEQLDELKKSKSVSERLDKVRLERLESDAPSTRRFANEPHKFVQRAGMAKYYTIAISGVSSENRDYLPCDLLSNDCIISNKNFGLFDAPLWNMAIIASKLHWVWIGTVCVRLEMRFSYSNTLGWNTFPIPNLTEKNKMDLTSCAEEILIARERHFPFTIADMYECENMPEDLRLAHDRNDEVLERIYIGRRFKNDTERLEKLFNLYTQMISQRKAE